MFQNSFDDLDQLFDDYRQSDQLNESDYKQSNFQTKQGFSNNRQNSKVSDRQSFSKNPKFFATTAHLQIEKKTLTNPKNNRAGRKKTQLISQKYLDSLEKKKEESQQAIEAPKRRKAVFFPSQPVNQLQQQQQKQLQQLDTFNIFTNMLETKSDQITQHEFYQKFELVKLYKCYFQQGNIRTVIQLYKQGLLKRIKQQNLENSKFKQNNATCLIPFFGNIQQKLAIEKEKEMDDINYLELDPSFNQTNQNKSNYFKRSATAASYDKFIKKLVQQLRGNQRMTKFTFRNAIQKISLVIKRGIQSIKNCFFKKQKQYTINNTKKISSKDMTQFK